MKTVRLLSGVRGTAAIRRPWSLKRELLELLSTALLPVTWLWESWLSCWANHKGSEGTVKVGANTVAEIRSWEMNVQADTIEDTELGDAAKTFKSGNYGWSGSVSCFWDETDTNGQEALTIGASVTLTLYPEGAATGAKTYSGSVIVTGITRRAGINTMVEADFTFQGAGALT